MRSIKEMDKRLDEREQEIERLKEENDRLEDYNEELMEERNRLNNIIDKAIDYIDWQRRNPQYDNVWRNAECEDLIEILKGE